MIKKTVFILLISIFVLGQAAYARENIAKKLKAACAGADSTQDMIPICDCMSENLAKHWNEFSKKTQDDLLAWKEHKDPAELSAEDRVAMSKVNAECMSIAMQQYT